MNVDPVDVVSALIALVALTVSIFAVWDGRRAAQEAERQAARSANAAERSAAAAEMRLGLELRATLTWKREGRSVFYRLTNVGKQPAYNVQVRHPYLSNPDNLQQFAVIEGDDNYRRVKFVPGWGFTHDDVSVTFQREVDGPSETHRYPM